MTAPEVIAEAAAHGLSLRPRGDKLDVLGKPENCPPDFLDVLRAHKAKLLAWLADNPTGLRPDEIPWLHVARQILASEFDGADRSTCESLAKGLRAIRHPTCRAALDRIDAKGIHRSRRINP